MDITENYVKESVKELAKNMYMKVRDETEQKKYRVVWGLNSDQMFDQNIFQALKDIAFDKITGRVYVGHVIMNKTKKQLYSNHMVPFMFDYVRMRISREEHFDEINYPSYSFYNYREIENSLSFKCKAHISMCKNKEQLKRLLFLMKTASFAENACKSNKKLAELLIISNGSYTDLEIQIFRKVLNGAKHGIFIILPSENYNEEKEQILLQTMNTSSNAVCFHKFNLGEFKISSLNGCISIFVDEIRSFQRQNIIEKTISRSRNEKIIASYEYDQNEILVSLTTVHNFLRLRVPQNILPKVSVDYKILELSYCLYENENAFSHYLMFSKRTGFLEKVTSEKRFFSEEKYNGAFIFDFNIFIQNLSSVFLDGKTWGSFYNNTIDVFNLGSRDIMFSNRACQLLTEFRVPANMDGEEYFYIFKEVLKNNIENFLLNMNDDDIETMYFSILQELPSFPISEIELNQVINEDLNETLRIKNSKLYNYKRIYKIYKELNADGIFLEEFCLFRKQKGTLY